MNTSERVDLNRAKDGFEARCIRDVLETGCHVLNVFDENGKLPPFSYSVGLFHNFGHPEILVYGLDEGMKVINHICRNIHGGTRYTTEGEYQDLLEATSCRFKDIKHEFYREHLGWNLWFYGDSKFPALQLLWHDRHKRFPWDKSCNDLVKKRQPLLFAHPH
jgi:hypothetical protein